MKKEGWNGMKLERWNGIRGYKDVKCELIGGEGKEGM